jgi:biopolymer transport protein ExbD
VNFRQNLKLVPSSVSVVVPFAGIVIQAVFLFLLVWALSAKSAFDVRIPRAVTSDISHDESQVVTITGEDIVYLNGRVMTTRELKDLLGKPVDRRRPLLIKADHRASVGRIVEVWNLARDLGLERVDLATDRGE